MQTRSIGLDDPPDPDWLMIRFVIPIGPVG